MARVAFFRELLPPDDDPVSTFAFELARSLADQQHEIRIFSTYRHGADLPASHPRIEILRPFRRWSWLELPRLIPLLLDFSPEIVHLVQPRAEALKGLTNAMGVLPGMTSLMSRPAVISSFYDVRREDLKLHRALLMRSDVVTVSNEPQVALMQEFLASLGRSTPVALLPVPAEAVRQRGSGPEPEGPLSDWLGSNSDLIFVPGDVGEHLAPDLVFAELAEVLSEFADAVLVLGGGWGRVPLRDRHTLMRVFDERGVGGRVLLTGGLAANVERLCLARAHVVVTASLAPESIELARALRGALEESAPLVMSEVQASKDALTWSHGENALLASPEPGSIRAALRVALGSREVVDRIRSRLPEFSRAEAVDRPGNVMSRIYARLVDGRRG